MAATKIKYNLEDLERQALVIEGIAQNLEEARTKLKTNLDTLKGEWVSDASTKFFSDIDSDWDTAVQHYIEMLEELSGALKFAAGKYEPIEGSYNALGLS